MKAMHKETSGNAKTYSKSLFIYKSGFPLNTWLLIIIPLLLLAIFLISHFNLFVLAVYLPIALLLYFIFFSRYASRIEITNALEMNIIFFFPWNKNISINLRKFKYIDYARGFYDPFDYRRLGYLSFYRKCYDLIMLSDNTTNSNIEIKVNMKTGAFSKIIKYLTVDAGLQLIKLKSNGEIIW